MIKKFENKENLENLNTSVNSENENSQNSQQENLPTSFDEMGLNTNLLRGIYGYGFEVPSPIQQQAIIPIINGLDLIGQAQSGTGKTAAFAIGTLQKINPMLLGVQTLVLAPTRELAIQIYLVYTFLSEFMNLKIHLAIGGTAVKNDILKLQEGAHIVVGCPGRILDMIKKNFLLLNDLNSLILDEADEMLQKGFLESFKDIVSYIPPTCKILLFSATLNKEVLALTDLFMENPEKILVEKEKLTLKGIKQYYVLLKKADKLDILMQIYSGIEIAQAIIYCNSKGSVDFLTNEMQKRGHRVSSIHSEKKQCERNEIMKDFRCGATRVLITTDLLARGIDVYQVSLVINYELPREKDTYLHRIGRSGRFGRKGTAINFVTPDEKEDLETLQKFYDTIIVALPTDLSEM